MLITSIYNMADTYFVGTLGESAQAATGILFTVQAIMQGLASCSATARAPMFPGRWQTGTPTKPPCTFPLPSSPAWAGLVIGVLGLAFLRPLVHFLGSTDTIAPYAMDYGFWVFLLRRRLSVP